MDEASRGIATASLTLQTVMLQALVAKGVLTRDEDGSGLQEPLGLAVTPDDDEGEEIDEAAEVALSWLDHLREGLEADLPARH
jgi:hypothetical protein